MLTLTSEYALRATIYLAQRADDWPIPGRVIAQQTGVPAKYLSAILRDLVRAGVLTSTRGKNGGFRMAQPPAKTMLLRVLAPFERLGPERCPFGNIHCSDGDPCLAHAEWKKVLESRMRFLGRTSVQQVAMAEPLGGRKRPQPKKARKKKTSRKKARRATR